VVLEMIAIIICVVAGLATRNISWASGRWKRDEGGNDVNLRPWGNKRVELASNGSPRYELKDFCISIMWHIFANCYALGSRD